MTEWLEVHRGDLPLIVSFPHTGVDIPREIEDRLVSRWMVRKDVDWWVHRVYDCASEMGATTIRTSICRTVIDVNRDPCGASLYPGEPTTELCPLTTFDGEPLYKVGADPDSDEIASRRAQYFDPYHDALSAEIERLRHHCGVVVLYDAHSIRSRVPRLFAGELPHLNIGTNNGGSCDESLTKAIERACEDPKFCRVTNGRFRGGWTTRQYGCPARGVHAVQMELACRGYLVEPEVLTEDSWPPRYDVASAEPLRTLLRRALRACPDFLHA
jgi:N-formylglutamate deformylase